MTLPDHLFVSESDGHLYDTRVEGWSKLPPLRKLYCRHCPDISSARFLKATLRAGPYTWLGGCPLYFIMADGESLSFESARAEFRLLVAAFGPDGDPQWRIEGCQINYEDSDMVCCHSGKHIPCASGDDDEESES